MAYCTQRNSTCVLVQVLAEQGNEASLPALRAIPRHLRTMYLHAAQSFFWNAAASERVRLQGLQVGYDQLTL